MTRRRQDPNLDRRAIFRWMGGSGRPFGSGVRTVGFSARKRGPAELVKGSDGWHLTGDPEGAVLSTDDAARLVASEDLGLRYVHVVADVAGHLFQEAVARAQASLAHLLSFDREVSDVAASIDQTGSAGFAKFVLASVELDRAFRAGATGVVLAVAAAEAQANEWAQAGGGWHRHEDAYPVHRKLHVLAARRQHDLSLGGGVLHELAQVVRSRRELVHASGAVQVLALTAQEGLQPSRAMSLGSRRACFTVRESLVTVARLLGYDLPPYLAFCPHASPEDDAAWATAVVMTGIRPDHDFPPILRSEP